MIVVRQSTARTVTIGPILDADGVAVTDGVVADFKIAKNGGAPAALNGSATLTHRHTGHYSLALTASDLDTVGQAEIVIDDAANACPMKELTVIEEAVYDALYAASAPGYLQPTTAGRTLDVTATGAAGIDWGNVENQDALVLLSDTAVFAVEQPVSVSAVAADAINASALATDAVNEIRNAITGGAYALDTDANGRIRIVNGTGAGELDTLDGMVLVRAGGVLGSPFVGVTFSDDLIAINDNIGSIGSGVVNIVQNLGTPTQFTTVHEGLDSLTLRIPAALVGGRMDSSVGAMAANVVTAAAIADGAIDRATFAADTGLQTIRSGTAQAGATDSLTLDASASSVADFYKDCYLLTTGGTGAGQYRICTAYNATTKLATVSPSWSVNPAVGTTFAVLPHGAAILGNVLHGGTGASLRLSNLHVQNTDGAGVFFGGSTNGLDIQGGVGPAILIDSQAADAMHIISDASGRGIRIGTGTADIELITNTAPTLRDAILTAGSITPTVAPNLDAAVSTRAEQTSLDTVSGQIGDTLSYVSGPLQASVDDLPTNAELATALAAADDAVLAAIAALNNLSAAQVNAEVVDALSVDTYAEPTGVPAATVSLAAKIGRLYKALMRGVGVTAAGKTFKNADGDAEWVKSLADDGTTYTEGNAAAP